MDVFALCDVVREAGFAAHKYLGSGHMEKIYENSLARRLRNLGYRAEQQTPIVVRDEDGTVLGDYFADMVVEQTLLIELKACRALTDEHVAQILGYLRATGIEHGLLINFGAPRFQIRKYALSRHRPAGAEAEDQT